MRSARRADGAEPRPARAAPRRRRARRRAPAATPASPAAAARASGVRRDERQPGRPPPICAKAAARSPTLKTSANTPKLPMPAVAHDRQLLVALAAAEDPSAVSASPSSCSAPVTQCPAEHAPAAKPGQAPSPRAGRQKDEGGDRADAGADQRKRPGGIGERASAPRRRRDREAGQKRAGDSKPATSRCASAMREGGSLPPTLPEARHRPARFSLGARRLLGTSAARAKETDDGDEPPRESRRDARADRRICPAPISRPAPPPRARGATHQARGRARPARGAGALARDLAGAPSAQRRPSAHRRLRRQSRRGGARRLGLSGLGHGADGAEFHRRRRRGEPALPGGRCRSPRLRDVARGADRRFHRRAGDARRGLRAGRWPTA